MTNTSDSSGSTPTDAARPDWSWLQAKLDAATAGTRAVAELDDWLDDRLSDLESTFASFVTRDSLTRDLKRSTAKLRK